MSATTWLIYSKVRKVRRWRGRTFVISEPRVGRAIRIDPPKYAYFSFVVEPQEFKDWRPLS